MHTQSKRMTGPPLEPSKTEASMREAGPLYSSHVTGGVSHTGIRKPPFHDVPQPNNPPVGLLQAIK